MAVVSDTSSLSYLILIGEVEVLSALYEKTVIPPAVEKELRSPEGPGPPRRWSQAAPAWLHVKEPPREATESLSLKTDERLRSLDRGERQAIGLAKLISSELLTDPPLV